MRRDTAAPSCWGSTFSYLFSASGACRFMLAVPLVDLVWSRLMSFDLVKFLLGLASWNQTKKFGILYVCWTWQMLSELCWFRKSMCKHRSNNGVPKQQIHQQFDPNYRTSIQNRQNVNRDRFVEKVLSKTPTSRKILCFFMPFGTTGPIQRVIWGWTGSRRGSTNRVFGYHLGKWWKKGVPKRDTKNIRFWSKTCANIWGFGRWKRAFRLIFVAK